MRAKYRSTRSVTRLNVTVRSTEEYMGVADTVRVTPTLAATLAQIVSPRIARHFSHKPGAIRIARL